jgi:hypothetical protein
MSSTQLKTAYVLSVIIAILALVASAGGLLINNLYQGNAFLSAAWFGSDLVTLFVALPILTVSMVLSLRGSGRARLVWLGMLAYMLYNFAYYVFGTAFNSLFLVYVAILDLSVLALLFALVRLDVEEIGRRFRPATPARWIAGFMAFVAVGLTVFYAATSLTFVVSGQIPEIVTLTGNLTSIVFALDLSLVVPWFVLAAIWLWQRRPWGHVLAVILNVKSAVYMLALSAATVSGARAGVTDDLSQVGLWGFIGVGSLITSLFLLGNLKPADR